MLLFTASDLNSITSHIHSWVLFLLGSIPSFFLELVLHWSPVVCWVPTDRGNFFQYPIICLFILLMGFSRPEHWSGLPFPSPADHILSDFSTMTRPSWVAHMAWLSFIELDKGVVHVIRLVSFLRLGFSVSVLWCPLTTPTVLLGFLLPWTGLGVSPISCSCAAYLPMYALVVLCSV